MENVWGWELCIWFESLGGWDVDDCVVVLCLYEWCDEVGWVDDV